MKQTIRDIIEDQRSMFSSQSSIERWFPEGYITNQFIIVISGIRRCGKSILLQQIRSRLTESDCFFNFDDDRLASFTQDNFQDLYEVMIELYGDQKYFFFDEIQNVKGWEHFVKRLYNQGRKVFVTGSNARMLSRELGTLLTGCYLPFDLYPFSFKEYLRYREIDYKKTSGTKQRSLLQSAFEGYMRDGGMPLYLLTQDGLVLKTLYDNILYRDILVRNNITNERELKELVYFLVSNIGKPVTNTSLSKVIGVKNPTTAKSYLDHVENTYLMMSLMRIDASVIAQLRSPRKIYCIDNAIAMQLGFRMTNDRGRLLENLIYVELRRRGGELYYYNDDKAECDFVVKNGVVVTQVIQVCYDVSDALTRERELKGLTAAMRAFGLDEGLLITLYTSEEVMTDAGRVNIVPALRWMLE